jgi:hypothetical protein
LWKKLRNYWIPSSRTTMIDILKKILHIEEVCINYLTKSRNKLQGLLKRRALKFLFEENL